MEQALKANEGATRHEVRISECSEIDTDLLHKIQAKSENNRITLFSLPHNNVVLNSFDENASKPFIHIMNGKVRFSKS